MKKTAAYGRLTSPIVAAVVLPVARRLAKIEALLTEVRHEQDVKLRRLSAIQNKLDALTEIGAANQRTIRRLQKRPA